MLDGGWVRIGQRYITEVIIQLGFSHVWDCYHRLSISFHGQSVQIC